MHLIIYILPPLVLVFIDVIGFLLLMINESVPSIVLPIAQVFMVRNFYIVIVTLPRS